MVKCGNEKPAYLKHLSHFWQKLLLKQTHKSILTTTFQRSSCLSRLMDTLWGLSVPSFFFFMMPDGWPYTQSSALSIMSWTLIPKLVVGTGCAVQMKVAAHCSDCCFNWSPEPLDPSLSPLLSKPLFSFSCSSFCHLLEVFWSSRHLLSELGQMDISRDCEGPVRLSCVMKLRIVWWKRSYPFNQTKNTGYYGYHSW